MRISDWSSDVCSSDLTVRAWIPYPQALPGHQEDIRFVASEPAAHEIAPESAQQRTAYFEKPAQAGEPTEFSVTYELTIFGQYHDIDPGKVVAADITPELAPFVAERAPPVVFNADLRAFSDRKAVVYGKSVSVRVHSR